MDETERRPSGSIIYGVLIGGMIIMSFASPMLKILLDLGLPSPSITFYRIFISTLVLVCVIASKPSYRAEVRSVKKRDFYLLFASGFLRAATMLLWITALKFSPVFLVSALQRTNPIWVIIASYLFLGKITPLKSLIGVAVCLLGVAVCAWGGATDANNNPIGMILILFNAILFAINLIISGVIREKFSLWPTMGMTFSIAAVLIFIVCVITGTPLGPFSLEAWIWIGVLALMCTLVSQSAQVWALKHMPATNVSLFNLMGPFFAGITAFLMRGEVPNVLTILGTLVMMCGLAVYFRMESKNKQMKALLEQESEKSAIQP